MIQYLRMHPNISVGILIVLYTVGIFSVKINLHEDFLLLTPFNLLISLGLVLVYHTDWTRKSVLVLLACFLLGYGIEVLGVQTGLIFGSYHYGAVLGYKLWKTPLMIGINWLMLVYCAAVFIHTMLPTIPTILKAGLGGAVLLLLDLLIEPVAVRYDFWTWNSDAIPVQNYIAWYIISVLLLWLFYAAHPKITNKLAIVLLLLQFIFFLIL